MLTKLFNFFQGRSTAFFCGFFVSGTTLHIYNRLDATYITFMATLLGFVVGHSVKEDLLSNSSANIEVGGGNASSD